MGEQLVSGLLSRTAVVGASDAPVTMMADGTRVPLEEPCFEFARRPTTALNRSSIEHTVHQPANMAFTSYSLLWFLSLLSLLLVESCCSFVFPRRRRLQLRANDKNDNARKRVLRAAALRSSRFSTTSSKQTTTASPPPPAVVSVVSPAPQLLQFREPQTNVTVVLVGAMHYNPASVRLAADTVRELGSASRLGSVIVESCDVRWNKTAELYASRPFLKAVLTNEMRAACDVALDLNRPVVLGDQRINITTAALKQSLKATVQDLVMPPQGWKRLSTDVSLAWQETVPFHFGGGQGHITPLSFLDPRLLLVLPVSLIKYPLSFLFRDPVPTSIVLAFLFGLSYSSTNDATAMMTAWDLDAVLGGQQAAVAVPQLSDWVASIAVAVLETTVFARLLLRPLLAERNRVLASSILEQCKLYSSRASSRKTGRSSFKAPSGENKLGGWFRSFRNPKKNDADADADADADSNEIVYVPGSPMVSNRGKRGGDSEKVVVAILGMAHCNGIMKLLTEQKVQ